MHIIQNSVQRKKKPKPMTSNVYRAALISGCLGTYSLPLTPFINPLMKTLALLSTKRCGTLS